METHSGIDGDPIIYDYNHAMGEFFLANSVAVGTLTVSFSKEGTTYADPLATYYVYFDITPAVS